MSNSIKTITEFNGLAVVPRTEQAYEDDMRTAKRMNLPVHEWSGEDRAGQPLTVVWVTTSHLRHLISSYEITGGRVIMDLSFALKRVEQIEQHLAGKHPRASKDAHLAGLLRSLRDELEDQRIITEAGGE